ncbi:MAG: nucleotide exchange factor GrpE [Ignavibacteria bacterium]|nr:nucleotide exchange factor GrpE [Ignavibacteria bacterium]
MTKKNDKHKDNNDDAINKNGSGTDNKEESNNKEIEALKSELDNYRNALLRKAAEFENYKRRTDGEIAGYLKYASEGLMKQLLPVYDDLSRSIESVEKGETKDFDTLKQGILLIYDKFKDILVKEGVAEIDILGKEFDVDTCDALLQVPRDDVPPHTVVDVAEKGYKLKDKVIKFAKVIVSADMPKEQENTK